MFPCISCSLFWLPVLSLPLALRHAHHLDHMLEPGPITSALRCCIQQACCTGHFSSIWSDLEYEIHHVAGKSLLRYPGRLNGLPSCQLRRLQHLPTLQPLSNLERMWARLDHMSNSSRASSCRQSYSQIVAAIHASPWQVNSPSAASNMTASGKRVLQSACQARIKCS